MKLSWLRDAGLGLKAPRARSNATAATNAALDRLGRFYFIRPAMRPAEKRRKLSGHRRRNPLAHQTRPTSPRGRVRLPSGTSGDRRGRDSIPLVFSNSADHSVYRTTSRATMISLVSPISCSSTVFYRLVMLFEGNLRAISYV